MKRDKLIQYRGDRKQADMAKKFGVTQQAWSLYENGIKTPSLPIMKRIEDDSGIPMEEIFFDAFNNSR